LTLTEPSLPQQAHPITGTVGRRRIASPKFVLTGAGSAPNTLEAYAKSVGEIAKLAAIAEGYSPEVGQLAREGGVRKDLGEGMDDPVHPHAERLFPST
jgi:hypothetical protein